MAATPPLLDDEVHWLCFRLDGPLPPSAADCLSADERARAARWLRRRDSDRFIAGRVGLRQALARYLQVAPAAVPLTAGAQGKPLLADGAGALQFNLSHSGEVAVLALSRAGAVGVDVEALQPMADCAAIAQRQFAPGEWQRWSRLAPAHQLAAFYACWTRKEAYLKALGGGLSLPLDGFEVAFEPDAPAALLTVGGSAQAAAPWSMWAPEPAPGHLAAVVVRGRGLTLRQVDMS